MIKINYIEVRQPIGTFYLSSIPASVLTNIATVISRGDSDKGVQRDRSNKRVKDIGEYCSDPDAVFPTPIVISVNDNAHVDINEIDHVISFDENEIIGEVIDGQHRLWGIETSERINEFDLPVVLMFGLDLEEKAYVFATINSNQKQVNPSLIFDLFGVASERSPQKTVHEIARVMNYDSNSPFYYRLKMLGKKTVDQENATLSQGTFAKSILQLITKNPNRDRLNIKNFLELEPDNRLPFRQYFIDNRDEVIIKIIFNCFNALKKVFYTEWEYPNDNILWKTTGFRGVVYAMPDLYKFGTKIQDLSQSYFEECFLQFQKNIVRNNLRLTSEYFPGGGEQGQKTIANLIKESLSVFNI
jgi:DGQHR domain-containing protein